jgi:hypothetical protein
MSRRIDRLSQEPPDNQRPAKKRNQKVPGHHSIHFLTLQIHRNTRQHNIVQRKRRVIRTTEQLTPNSCLRIVQQRYNNKHHQQRPRLLVSNLDIRPHAIEGEEGNHQGVMRARPDDKHREQVKAPDGIAKLTYLTEIIWR